MMMRRQTFHHSVLALIFLFLGGAIHVLAQDIRAEAGFEPSVLSAGQRTSYQIVLVNPPSVPSLAPPEVNGLEFDDSPFMGRQSQTNIINGRVQSVELVTFTWRVSVTKEGTYTVPAQRVSLGGTDVVVPEAKLRVVPQSENEKSAMRLEWKLPDRELYVGEALPASLQLYVRQGVQVGASGNSPLQKIGDGFTFKAFEDFKNSHQEVVNEIPYTVYEAAGIITPIRAGELNLRAVLSVSYTDPYSNTRVATDFFGMRRQIRQERDLSTEERSFTVVEPPNEGRLPGFNGAIGEFKTSALLGTTTVRAGEPLTLTFSLTGKGNFDRISAPEIADTDDWRVYPPKVNFSDQGTLGISGTKSFEYLLIPRSEAVTATPTISFAAFNPEKQTYQDLSAAPKEITVTPAPLSDAEATIYAQVGGSDEAAASSRVLRPNRADLGPTSRRIVPVFLEPTFLGSQGVIALAFALVFFWQKRRHRLEHDELYARRIVGSRSVRNWTRKAQEAAVAKDPVAFYGAAQRALQESVGRQFPRRRKAESLTASEIDEVLQRNQISETTRGVVAEIFNTGDALRYAGTSAAGGEIIVRHAEKLTETLRDLHKGLSS